MSYLVAFALFAFERSAFERSAFELFAFEILLFCLLLYNVLPLHFLRLRFVLLGFLCLDVLRLLLLRLNFIYKLELSAFEICFLTFAYIVSCYFGLWCFNGFLMESTYTILKAFFVYELSFLKCSTFFFFNPIDFFIMLLILNWLLYYYLFINAHRHTILILYEMSCPGNHQHVVFWCHCGFAVLLLIDSENVAWWIPPIWFWLLYYYVLFKTQRHTIAQHMFTNPVSW